MKILKAVLKFVLWLAPVGALVSALIVAPVVVATTAAAQSSTPTIVPVPSAPSACGTLPLYIVGGTNHVYGDNGSGGCAEIGANAGSGTVNDGTLGEVTYYGSSGDAVSGAAHFLTNGSHQAMGSTGTIDGVPTIFWGSASAILNAQETSTTATGSNGIYVDETWAPASTVTPGGTGVFGIGSNVTVNLDGQATGDTYSAAADFTLSDESNTTGAGQEYAEYVNFNKTGTSTDGEISVLDIEGTMTAGTESDHITNTLSHFAFSGGDATGSGAQNTLYDATLTVSGGTPGSWNFYRVNAGDTQLTSGTIPILTLFEGGGAFGKGATITNIVDFSAGDTSGGANVTGLYIGQMTGGTTSLQIDSEGTANSLFKGLIQAAGFSASDGTPGVSKSCTTAFTIKEGLVTSCT
jgi:hypothetical protein